MRARRWSATLPTYLNALSGKGVHVVTVNDYLARFQAEWMGRVYHFLGLDYGVILPEMSPAERRVAYSKDITYGTNNEFGFDYLRDNMAGSIEDCVQREHNYAIVDEVDSILVDEARTPLIISGPAEDSQRWYVEMAKIATMLKPRIADDKVPEEQRPVADYEVDEKKRTVAILERGIEKVEDRLGIDNLYESANTPLISYLNNALKAKDLFRKDKDYVVVDNEVLIVDEHTGRTLHGRRYNEGLHQAIEAKEGVEIKEEYQTLATITLQNYFRLYSKLAGMTGTAMTEAAEFSKVYGLGVVPIPTNKPMIRVEERDLIYRTEDAKFDAVVKDIVEVHQTGQPILVGTTSVEKSERLSAQLRKENIAHEVLNAKQHAREAAIVAEAGRKGAVTVATNMAGRGTDIILGGNPEHLADKDLRARGIDPVESAEEYEAEYPKVLEQFEKQVKDEQVEVSEAGGLYVLGTERHESRRIDNQLRGRSGRQGDPGKSRFYLSLEDDLMRLFKREMVDWAMSRNNDDSQPLENKVVTKAIASAQSQVEAQNFETRKNILKYDDVMNRQRHVVYDERRRVLEGADLREQVSDMLEETVTGYVQGATADGFAEDWDLDALFTAMKTLYSTELTEEELIEEAGGERAGLTQDFLVERFIEDAQEAYDAARGAARRGRDARAGAPGRTERAGPQVARAPVRDGLPARGHRPARDGAARPAGRVPARGLRHVRRDDGVDQGRVGRLHLQRRGRRRGDAGRDGAAARPRPPGTWTWTATARGPPGRGHPHAGCAGGGVPGPGPGRGAAAGHPAAARQGPDRRQPSAAAVLLGADDRR